MCVGVMLYAGAGAPYMTSKDKSGGNKKISQLRIVNYR
jgi:hypothetical protein